MTNPNLTIRDSAAAFDSAIAAGVLSPCAADANYAGGYMYMNTLSMSGFTFDHFRHIETRRYVSAPVTL